MPQILSNSTKIYTNTETAILSRVFLSSLPFQVGNLQDSEPNPQLQVSVAEQRPGTGGMYGGNLDLVSRRENVQVGPICGQKIERKNLAWFIQVDALMEYYEENDGQHQRMLKYD